MAKTEIEENEKSETKEDRKKVRKLVIKKKIIKKKTIKKKAAKIISGAKDDKKTSGETGRAKNIKDIVKRQLTILMKKGASEAVRVSAAKSLMDIIYKQQEAEGYGDEGDGDNDRESAIAECVRLLDEIAASLSGRGARKIEVA